MSFNGMASPEGVEPSTPGFGSQCSSSELRRGESQHHVLRELVPEHRVDGLPPMFGTLIPVLGTAPVAVRLCLKTPVACHAACTVEVSSTCPDHDAVVGSVRPRVGTNPSWRTNVKAPWTLEQDQRIKADHVGCRIRVSQIHPGIQVKGSVLYLILVQLAPTR
jgi:hypothetical protein